MVIVTPSKDVFPTRHVNAPPPYSLVPATTLPESAPSSSTSPAHLGRATFHALPQHILLHIVYATIPSLSTRAQSTQVEALYWLTHSLRLVSRALFIASMHYLRTAFLDDYASNVKFPYSSDSFPLEPPETTLPPQFQRPQSIQSLQRETAILDRFIALKCSEDMRSQESELHLDLDYFKDIFELLQPKARSEDLLLKYGLRAGVISLVAPALGTNTSTSRLPTPLPFAAISVNFSPRKVGVVIQRRTVAEVKRERDEKLESVAKRLVTEVARVLGRSTG